MCAPSFNNCDVRCAGIARFAGKLLGQPVEVPHLKGQESVRQLRAHMIDAFISVGTLSEPDMDCTTIGTLPTEIAMAEDHPLAQFDEITINQISRYPVLNAPEFDTFNEFIFTSYRKHGLTSPAILPTSKEDFHDFVRVQHGLSFAVHIPWLSIVSPGSVARPIAAKDMLPIPICLVSMRSRKSKIYLALERLLKTGVKLF